MKISKILKEFSFPDKFNQVVFASSLLTRGFYLKVSVKKWRLIYGSESQIRLGSTFQIEHSIFYGIANRTISTQASLEHARKHRHIPVDIVINANLGLVGMKAVESSGLLSQCSFPGHRQG